MSDDNLVLRAAKAFFAATKLKSAVSIELKKRIPHGAGLGGGSSDADSTLLGLDEVCVPVAKNGNIPGPTALNIAQWVDLACYDVAAGDANVEVNLSQLNPVLADQNGLIAVDARVAVAPLEPARRSSC